MKALALRNWLPHEIIFTGFILITLLRLLWHAGFLIESTEIYISCLIATILVIGVCETRPTITTWRVRLLLYPILIHIIYINMKQAVPLFHPAHDDALLLHADQWLIGGDLAIKLQNIATPILTEFLTICYLLFFPYLFYCMYTYLMDDLEVAKKFYVGLFTIYGIGYTGYTFLPALGPYITLASQLVPLKGFWVTHIESLCYPLGTNDADVFPSLHCAVTAYILWFDHRYCENRFKWLLVPVIGMWFSTIYLRYHYFVDVIAGFMLAMVGVMIARLYETRTKSCHSTNSVY